VSGEKEDQVFTSTPSDGEIRIGRRKTCQLCFSDPDLSQYQAAIDFVKGAWVLTDGTRGRPSSNGTWLFLLDPTEISAELVFRVGATLFKAAKPMPS
jgi:hypothetical protein